MKTIVAPSLPNTEGSAPERPLTPEERATEIKEQVHALREMRVTLKERSNKLARSAAALEHAINERRAKGSALSSTEEEEALEHSRRMTELQNSVAEIDRTSHKLEAALLAEDALAVFEWTWAHVTACNRILAVMAEMEEQKKVHKKTARRGGKRSGHTRKQKASPKQKQAREMRSANKGVKQIAAALEVSPSTVYGWTKGFTPARRQRKNSDVTLHA